MKLLWIVLLAVIACRVLLRRWPWDLLRSATRSSNEAQARAVLGLGRSPARHEVIDAHRRMLARVHPDRGGSNEAVHQANAARDLLLSRLPAAEPQMRDDDPVA